MKKTAVSNHLIRNIAVSLILHEKIKTNLHKAKIAIPYIEKMLAVAKKNDLMARRRLLAFFFDKKAVAKIFDIIVPNMKTAYGFINIFRLPAKRGDASQQVLISLKPELVKIKETNKIAEKRPKK